MGIRLPGGHGIAVLLRRARTPISRPSPTWPTPCSASSSAIRTQKNREPLLNRSKYDDWIPKDSRFNDGGFLSDGVGRYRPNAWGLCDMHGNVAEWTRSADWPYPYQDDDGRNEPNLTAEKRVVRGGSWRDLPPQARSGVASSRFGRTRASSTSVSAWCALMNEEARNTPARMNDELCTQ